MLEQELISVGKELYERGLQSTRSGNLSLRQRDSFIISKTGTNLGRLALGDLISVPLDPSAPIPRSASCESAVHRAIYNASDAGAIVHAHGPYAIALAEMEESGVKPIHNEAIAGLGWIPIIDTAVTAGEGGEHPGPIAEQMHRWCSLIVRGHGSFVSGSNLDEALYRMLLLEEACKIICIMHSMNAAPGRYRHPTPIPLHNGHARNGG